MIITLHNTNIDGMLRLTSTNPYFKACWGDRVNVTTSNLYNMVREISNFVEKEFGEKVLIDVE